VKTGRPIYSGPPEEILQVFAVAGKADGTDIGTWNGLEKCLARNCFGSKSGNPYLLTVQYPENAVSTLTDLKQIPLRGPNISQPTFLDSVVKVKTIASPTEVDHYQLFRVIDLYISPKTENLGTITPQIEKILKDTTMPEARVTLRGSVQGMQSSFKSFAIGLILSVVLVYLVLVRNSRRGPIR
jgi:multidrug efflux pump subunit AcrB